MKILLVCGSYYPQTIGGIENSMRHISAELLRAGHEVKMFSSRTDYDGPSRIKYEGVEIIRYSQRPERLPHRRLKERVELGRRESQPLLREFAPVAIWSREANLTVGIARSGYAGRILHIFSTTARMHYRGAFVYTRGFNIRRKLLMLGLYPFAYKTASQIEHELLSCCKPICFSENVRQQLLRAHGDLAERTRIIRPGVDTATFSRSVGCSQFKEIQNQYGLQPGEVFVLFVGRLSVAKNIPMLIEAMRHVPARVRLVLVGDGIDEFRLRKYVNNRGLRERVFFVGKQDRLLPGFYTMAKLCVVPTIFESFGQVFLESMACGTPVIGFAGDGRKVMTATSEIVQEGKTGRVVHKINPQALAESISGLLAMSRAQYSIMSEDAMKYVKQRFTWERFVRKMLSFSI